MPGTYTITDAIVGTEIDVSTAITGLPEGATAAETLYTATEAGTAEVDVVITFADSSTTTVQVSVTAAAAPVDKAALTSAIDAEYSDGDARTTYELTEADYTEATWTAYITAISDAITVEENAEADQAAVDAAAAAIGTAKGNLVFAGKADLDAAKAAADALTETDYTAASWADLTSALALPETTNAEVVDKTTAITAAQEDLVNHYSVTFTSTGDGTLTATVDGVAIQSGDKVAVGKVVTFTPETGKPILRWTETSYSEIFEEEWETVFIKPEVVPGFGDTFIKELEIGSMFISYGVDVVVEFGVAASINPTTANFDKSNPQDVEVSVSFNDESSITRIYANKYVSDYVTEPIDLDEASYSIDGNILTVNSDHLSNLPEGHNINGVLNLVIEFDKTNTELRINIIA